MGLFCRISPNSLTRSASTLPTRFLNYTARGTPAMRFTASMVSAPNFECTESDMKRHFVLSFYVEDNSLSISEPPNKETLTGTLSRCVRTSALAINGFCLLSAAACLPFCSYMRGTRFHTETFHVTFQQQPCASNRPKILRC